MSYGLQSHRYSAFCARRQVKTEDLITPGKKLLFNAPTLILDNGLDQAHHFGEPARMPSGFGTDRWLGAINGPVWNINATYYGHVDCLDAAFISMGKMMCPSNATLNKLLYHAELRHGSRCALRASARRLCTAAGRESVGHCDHCSLGPRRPHPRSSRTRFAHDILVSHPL